MNSFQNANLQQFIQQLFGTRTARFMQIHVCSEDRKGFGALCAEISPFAFPLFRPKRSPSLLRLFNY